MRMREKKRKRERVEKTTCSLRSSPSLTGILLLSAPFLSVDRMLITARMTLILPELTSSQKSSFPPLPSFTPSLLFTAPSWLLIFSATSLIMPAGYSVYSPLAWFLRDERRDDLLSGGRVILIKRGNASRYIRMQQLVPSLARSNAVRKEFSLLKRGEIREGRGMSMPECPR